MRHRKCGHDGNQRAETTERNHETHEKQQVVGPFEDMDESEFERTVVAA